MSIHLRQRDAISQRAYSESIGPAAKELVSAVAAGTSGLQAVMTRPADPRQVLSALVQLRASRAAVEQAESLILSWCLVGGLSRSGISTSLGIRPATLNRLLAPHADLAAARGMDLFQTPDGTWNVQARNGSLSGSAQSDAQS